MINNDLAKNKPRSNLSTFRCASLRKSINPQINLLSLSAIQSDLVIPLHKYQQTKSPKNIRNNKNVISPKYDIKAIQKKVEAQIMKEKIKQNIIKMLDNNNGKNQVFVVKQKSDSFKNFLNQKKLSNLQKHYRQFFEADINNFDTSKIKMPTKIPMKSFSLKKKTQNFIKSLREPCYITSLKLLSRSQTANPLIESACKMNKKKSNNEKSNPQLSDEKFTNKEYKRTSNSKRRNSKLKYDENWKKENQQIKGWELKYQDTINYY